VERRHLPRPAAAYAARITVAEKQSPGSRRGLEKVAPLSRLILGQAREPGAGRVAPLSRLLLGQALTPEGWRSFAAVG
jgi:hypothetical protein